MFQLKVRSYGTCPSLPGLFHLAGTVGRGDYRNYYKGHMDKTKGEGGEGGGRWVQLGWGGGMGRKGIQL